jgi:hypothetical protein
MLISSCSSSIVDESELDFVALTTGGDLVNGSDLWLNPNNSGSTGDLSESENGFGQDILLWFWAPN